MSDMIHYEVPNTSTTPVGPAGGDLVGTYPNPTLANTAQARADLNVDVAGTAATLAAAAQAAAIAASEPRQLIASIVLAAPAASVTFSAIPGTFHSLRLIAVAGHGGVGSDNLCAQFNADTGANYSYQYLIAVGAVTAASSALGGTFAGVGLVEGNAGAVTAAYDLIIPEYSSATMTPKKILGFSGETGPTFASTSAFGAWASAAAITSIKLFDDVANNLVAGSIFRLYGIL